jgi:hypothetical protein
MDAATNATSITRNYPGERHWIGRAGLEDQCATVAMTVHTAWMSSEGCHGIARIAPQR